jgi:hypothetical protein
MQNFIATIASTQLNRFALEADGGSAKEQLSAMENVIVHLGNRDYIKYVIRYGEGKR